MSKRKASTTTAKRQAATTKEKKAAPKKVKSKSDSEGAKEAFLKHGGN
jgi:hypothetical protein